MLSYSSIEFLHFSSRETRSLNNILILQFVEDTDRNNTRTDCSRTSSSPRVVFKRLQTGENSIFDISHVPKVAKIVNLLFFHMHLSQITLTFFRSRLVLNVHYIWTCILCSRDYLYNTNKIVTKTICNYGTLLKGRRFRGNFWPVR